MPKNLTTSSLRESILKSGLVSTQQLQDVEVNDPASTGDGSTLAESLLAAGLLTEWQLGKLRSGRHSGFFLGPYKLLSHIARGGMSTLYEAEHCETGNRRALKVLSPVKATQHSYLPRFIREADVASKLRHRNVVRVYELLKAKQGKANLHFIVMQFLNGRDLFRLVSDDGPLTVRKSADLIRQAANGLQHSHDAGLVHRDVKPGNLLLTDAGILKVVDLGLAAILESQDESLTRLCDEQVIGTADYLAPEQAIDSHRADHRADIYALGCTWYFLLTGHPPFGSGSLAQRILAHQRKEPTDIRELRPDLPEELAALLQAMMVKRRALRIQSCADVATRLEAWLNSAIADPEFDAPPRLPESHGSQQRRKLTRVPIKRRQPQTETPTASVFSANTKTNHSLKAITTPVRPRDCGSEIQVAGLETLVEAQVASSHSWARSAADSEATDSKCSRHTETQPATLVSEVPVFRDARMPAVDRLGPPTLACVAIASVFVLITDPVVWSRAEILLLNCW